MTCIYCLEAWLVMSSSLFEGLLPGNLPPMRDNNDRWGGNQLTFPPARLELRIFRLRQLGAIRWNRVGELTLSLL